MCILCVCIYLFWDKKSIVLLNFGFVLNSDFVGCILHTCQTQLKTQCRLVYLLIISWGTTCVDSLAIPGLYFTNWLTWFSFLLSIHFLPSPVPDPPLIDLSNSRVYNEASICWRLSDDHLPTDHHMLEYRRWVQTSKEITAREEWGSA